MNLINLVGVAMIFIPYGWLIESAYPRNPIPYFICMALSIAGLCLFNMK